MAACEWPIDRTCFPALPPLPDPPTQDQQAAYDVALAQRNSAEDTAVHVLWALSGRQFGVCEETVRPVPSPYARAWPCADRRVVQLPGPAVEVISVQVPGGAVLGSGAYALEGDALYRLGAPWPPQNFDRPLGEPDTWSVTYLRGITVPAGVDRLTGLLANEFMSACTNPTKCRIPRTVVSTTQRGVTHNFDATKILAAGYTGLPEVDLWLSAVNPAHLAEAPSVL